MDIISGLLQETDKFLIIMSRFAGIIFAPVYNTRNIPAIWKVGFTLLITLIAWQLGLADNFQVQEAAISYILVLISELTIGIILSLVAQFLFAAIQLAGEVIDTQMGFGIMNVVDPMSGTQLPIIGNFKYILAILVFLQVNGHHYFLQALFDSYQVIPIGHISFQTEFMSSIINFFGNIFVIGLKLSLPILGALLFTDFVLGIMNRTVPQMNIFMVGMPAKILLGFSILLGILPLYIYLLNTLISDMVNQLYQIIRALV